MPQKEQSKLYYFNVPVTHPVMYYMCHLIIGVRQKFCLATLLTDLISYKATWPVPLPERYKTREKLHETSDHAEYYNVAKPLWRYQQENCSNGTYLPLEQFFWMLHSLNIPSNGNWWVRSFENGYITLNVSVWLRSKCGCRKVLGILLISNGLCSENAATMRSMYMP